MDENCETYSYHAGCGKDSEEIIGETMSLEYGVCAWVWKNKRPWWKGGVSGKTIEAGFCGL